MRINAARVFVRPPGVGSWTSLPVTLGAPSRALTVGPVSVSWSRSTPRAHPDSGTITLSLICPPGGVDESRLVYDTAMRLEVQLAPDRPWKQLVFGWIQSYTRSLRHDGTYMYALTLMDVIGRAGATMIGMAPRPQETREARCNAINAASPVGPLIIPTTRGGNVLARDVDNQPALTLIRDTAGFSAQATEALDGMMEFTGRVPGWQLVVKETGGLWHAWRYTTPVWTVPARAIEDGPRVMDRTASISQVTLRYGKFNPSGPATEETTTYKLAVGSFSSSALSLSTDMIRIDEDSLKSWAEAIIRESSQPVLRLESVRIVLDRLPIDVAEGLIGIGTRDAAVIDIPDVPADLVNTVIMTAGTVTLDGRELQLRDVILTPGTVFGIRPLATSDLPHIVSTPPNFTTYPTDRPLAVNDLNVYAVANYLAVV